MRSAWIGRKDAPRNPRGKREKVDLVDLRVVCQQRRVQQYRSFALEGSRIIRCHCGSDVKERPSVRRSREVGTVMGDEHVSHS